MQTDCTVFRIPHQAQPEAPVVDFDVQIEKPAGNSSVIVEPTVDFSAVSIEAPKTQTLQFGPFQTERISYRPVEKAFPLYEELNAIAEELEKCRSRIS